MRIDTSPRQRVIVAVAGSSWPLAPLHAFNSRCLALYIYHGGSDPIFPVEHARAAARLMRLSGHEVLYHEEPLGGHEYTPEEAENIAAWFDTLDSGDG